MDVMDAIRHRFSVRRYQDKDIPREVLEEVLEAARLAPSAKNRQEWQFVVVTDPEKKMRLSQAAKGQSFVAQAPAVIAGVATETGYVMTCGVPAAHVDLAIAMEHVALAAVEHGLGTCWIGAFYQEQAREILDLPPEWKVVALMPIGYPAVEAPEKRRRPLEDVVLFL
ncbi:MAG: nitroreductase family protein [Candidatus Thermoplasmatota archaeon]|nr:nitroreductase family protein [Candidatus Thermoplasmatota archaeon]